jgi:hypothetical protein
MPPRPVVCSTCYEAKAIKRRGHKGDVRLRARGIHEKIHDPQSSLQIHVNDLTTKHLIHPILRASSDASLPLLLQSV